VTSLLGFCERLFSSLLGFVTLFSMAILIDSGGTTTFSNFESQQWSHSNDHVISPKEGKPPQVRGYGHAKGAGSGSNAHAKHPGTAKSEAGPWRHIQGAKPGFSTSVLGSVFPPWLCDGLRVHCRAAND
jgi:hypothetical protein